MFFRNATRKRRHEALGRGFGGCFFNCYRRNGRSFFGCRRSGRFLFRGPHFRRRRSLFCRRSFLNHSQHVADFDVFAFLPLDARQNSAALRADLEIDFFRFEFDKHIADGHTVALFFPPFPDRSLDNGLTQFGHDDFGRHDFSSLDCLRRFRLKPCLLRLLPAWR